MAHEPPHGDAIFRSYSRVNTLLIFGERVISSYEFPAPSGFGVSKIVFSFQMLWIGEGWLPVSCFGFRPLETEVVQGSLVEAAREVGGAYGSSILQSGTEAGKA